MTIFCISKMCDLKHLLISKENITVKKRMRKSDIFVEAYNNYYMIARLPGHREPTNQTQTSVVSLSIILS